MVSVPIDELDDVGPSSAVATRSDRIDREHAALRTAAQRLKSLCMVGGANQPGRHYASLLESELRRFTRMLLDHFEEEETGGYLFDVIQHRPGLQHRVEQLASEHETMRRKLAELGTTLAERCEEAASIRSDLLALLELLAQHELAENELFHQAYWLDLGGSG